MTPRIRLLVPLAALLAAAGPTLSAADVSQLVQETQKTSQTQRAIKMAWWMPTQFWQATLEQNGNLSEAERQEYVAMLDDYAVFAVAYIDLGNFGDTTPRNREQMLENLELTLDGQALQPLAPNQLTPNAAEFFATMRPAMANMMGQIGAGLEFIAYPNQQDGQELIDPLEKGSLKMEFYDQTFTWRLPLGSLLPPMIDEKTGERYPGNYRYSPFTGAELSSANEEDAETPKPEE